MTEAELEIESLKDSKKVIEEAEKWKIKLVLIGGYAVRAYTRGYRFTKDIDLVTTKEALGNLKALLRYLGYPPRDTEFGVAGSKSFNDGFIDLHISVGKIFDMSTGLTYPVTSNLFFNAKRLKITGYHKASKPHACKAPVIDLETLLVLKLVPTGRVKDTIDVLSLLLDRSEEINPAVLISRIPEEANFRRHLVSQLRSYAEFVRRGEADKLWFSTTGLRLSSTEKRKILNFIRKIVTLLKS